MKKTKTAVFLTRCGLVAALYTVLSLVLAPIGFGLFQMRISEMLTILPVFSFDCVWGLTVGCFLTNLVGAFTGMNILGFWDLLFGTLATLVAALLCYVLRRVRFHGIPFLSALPAVLTNAVVLGLEFMFLESGRFFFPLFWSNALLIAAEQFVPCVLLGLILESALRRTKGQKFFTEAAE